MVMKDLSSPSKLDENIYNIWLEIAKKTFSKHPDSQDGWSPKVFRHHPMGLDGLRKTFCDHPNTETETDTILKLMRITSVFYSQLRSHIVIVWFISGVQSVTVETRVELKCGTPVTASRAAMEHSAKRSERRKSSVPDAIVTDTQVSCSFYKFSYITH